MKIIVTTSDKYLHLLPVFFYLYNKYWGEPFELVGYTEPENLPGNCTFVSMGVDRGPKEWSTDLRAYFAKQPDWFVWMMEDTFIKSKVGPCPVPGNAGRIDLTNDVQKREHTKAEGVVIAHPASRYRLSTQPSIWNKQFLLQYLHSGMSPWEFETQDPKNDGYNIKGFVLPPITHNEGVRRFDIYKLNLEGMCQDDIDHIKTIAPWQS